MASVEQGDLLRVEGISQPVMVVSNNVFNRSGKAIVCPIMKKAVPGPLHIELKGTQTKGYVLCEQVRYLDLTARGYSKIETPHYLEIMDISDAVVSMFEYQ